MKPGFSWVSFKSALAKDILTSSVQITPSIHNGGKDVSEQCVLQADPEGCSPWEAHAE